MKVLRSRLYEMELRKQQEAIAKDRRSQVGTGERSEKIRTYNFRENRITDHRVNFTTHRLDRGAERRPRRAARPRHHALPVREAEGRDRGLTLTNSASCQRFTLAAAAPRGCARPAFRRRGGSRRAPARAARARLGHRALPHRRATSRAAGRSQPRLRSAGRPPRQPRAARPTSSATASSGVSPFEVTPAVLIPRPETELIVEASLEAVRPGREPFAIADVCTGSGCLAVALAHERPLATSSPPTSRRRRSPSRDATPCGTASRLA